MALDPKPELVQEDTDDGIFLDTLYGNQGDVL